jgi:hypothetical protein
MMAYAAYLQIYEPLSAFDRPNGTRWNSHALCAALPRLRALMRENGEAPRLWFTDFHPHSTIELGHGGPVCLSSGQALKTDAWVAGMAKAIESPARPEWEVAMAMHHRAHARWRCLRATAFAN